MNDHKPCPYPDGDDGLLEYGLWQLEKVRMASQNIDPAVLAQLENKDRQITNLTERNDELLTLVSILRQEVNRLNQVYGQVAGTVDEKTGMGFIPLTKET